MNFFSESAWIKLSHFFFTFDICTCFVNYLMLMHNFLPFRFFTIFYHFYHYKVLVKNVKCENEIKSMQICLCSKDRFFFLGVINLYKNKLYFYSCIKILFMCRYYHWWTKLSKISLSDLNFLACLWLFYFHI